MKTNTGDARQFDLLSIGEPMVEFSAIPGEPRRYLQGFGGDTMNAVIASARQGARAGYITRVGDDEFGDLIRGLLIQEGVDISGVAVEREAATGCYFISHSVSGHNFTYRRSGSAASHMTPDNVPLEMIAKARILHTSGISQAISTSACDAVFAAIAIARSSGTAVIYDPNLRLSLWPLARARGIVVATARQADYFLPSLEDGRLLSERESPEGVSRWFREQGVKCVVLKLGAQGVLVADGGDEARFPPHVVDCVDATGAGDCFAGALAAGLASGESLVAAVKYATVAAALTCTGYGAVAPVPTRSSVIDAMRTSGASP